MEIERRFCLPGTGAGRMLKLQALGKSVPRTRCERKWRGGETLLNNTLKNERFTIQTSNKINR